MYQFVIWIVNHNEIWWLAKVTESLWLPACLKGQMNGLLNSLNALHPRMCFYLNKQWRGYIIASTSQYEQYASKEAI